MHFNPLTDHQCRSGCEWCGTPVSEGRGIILAGRISDSSATSSPEGSGWLIGVRHARHIGVRQFLLNFQRADLARSPDRMQWCADEFMAKTW